MEAACTCFGFGEDEPTMSNDADTVHPKFVKPTTFRFVCTVNEPSRRAREMIENEGNGVNEQTLSPMPENPVSITQVQELLLHDISSHDETSFYEDECEDVEEARELSPIKVITKKRRNQKTNENAVNSAVHVVTPERKGATKKKNKRTIEDDNTENENVETPHISSKTLVRVFRRTPNKKPLEDIQNLNDSIVSLSAAKPVKNPPKKGKAKKAENEKNEQFDKLAEQMNSKFKEVEEFQLLVE